MEPENTSGTNFKGFIHHLSTKASQPEDIIATKTELRSSRMVDDIIDDMRYLRMRAYATDIAAFRKISSAMGIEYSGMLRILIRSFVDYKMLLAAIQNKKSAINMQFGLQALLAPRWRHEKRTMLGFVRYGRRKAPLRALNELHFQADEKVFYSSLRNAEGIMFPARLENPVQCSPTLTPR